MARDFTEAVAVAEAGYVSKKQNSLTARVFKESEEGKNLSPVFNTLDEMMESLNA